MADPWDDPEEEIRDLLDSIRNRFKGNFQFPLKSVLTVAVLVVAGLGMLSSAYTVKPEEKAVILRLGHYISTEGPGLHLRVPFGIDQVLKVQTEKIQQEEFGFRSENQQRRRSAGYHISPEEESSMLSGDLNVAEVAWIVQYKIADPRKYLFNTRDPIKNMRDVSQSVLRRVVGDRAVSDVLTTGRVEIAEEAQRLTQEVLDRYDMGVRIVTVKLQDVNPPEAVRPAFNEVNAAKQEQEQVINQAEKEYNQVIPEAKGKAQQQIRNAEGYATAAVNHAKGDANRFRETLQAYRTAPTITRTRLYLETVEELYNRFHEMIVVDKGVKGLLPVFQDLQGGARPSPGGKR